jgi:ABC-type multidrug transport system ATPase subunit
MIKMLLGLTRPTAGAAHVLGMDVTADRMAILQRTAFVSEKKTLYPSLTPSELVRFSRGFYFGIRTYKKKGQGGSPATHGAKPQGVFS